MPSDKTTTTDSADAAVNAAGNLLEVKVKVTADDGLSLGHLEKDVKKGDTVTLKEDVAKLLIARGDAELA